LEVARRSWTCGVATVRREPVTILSPLWQQPKRSWRPAVVRAVVGAQRALRLGPLTAAEIGKRLFPPLEGELIAEVVSWNAVFYDPTISEDTAAAFNWSAAVW
jgi:hypothetical protein